MSSLSTMKALVDQVHDRRLRHNVKAILIVAASLFLTGTIYIRQQSSRVTTVHHRPLHAEELLDTCASLKVIPGPPDDFASRSESERFVPGTVPTYIKNATIWIGRSEGVYESGDILIDKGLIVKVGHITKGDLPSKYDTIDAAGAWITPGIFDMHSHIGVYSSPDLQGASDGNSLKGPAQPWLRSLDGLNTHDESFRLSIAGGVTTSLILPGSADAIGGQAFAIKLRPTAERSPSSMVLEPPFTMNSSAKSPLLPHRWRHMKHACGENPSAIYGFTRMDTQWSFRKSYDEARKIKKKQDDFCAKVEAGLWNEVPDEFPESLQWEALVDVLRGRVKVNNHCYEAVDFDQQIRLTNEFKFSINSFHHAHEAYLVPGLLKKMYGAPPAIALFATNARYKREAYRGTEFAPRILSDEGLQVVMKSDHSVLDSRFLLYEAQQAHFYGLDHDLALASVTTTPAELQGFGHRLGYVKAGYDADLVIWDSHPLALGATPIQVFIDGISQLESPKSIKKPVEFQVLPRVPNFDKERKDAIKYEGLQPLRPSKKVDSVVFFNVRTIYEEDEITGKLVSQQLSQGDAPGIVVVHKGEIVCRGVEAQCSEQQRQLSSFDTIDVQGGVIAPGFLSYGGSIGLIEIEAESSTNDGVAFAPFKEEVPEIIGDEPLMRAADGLQFNGRDTLLAYRSGVTTAVTAPVHSSFIGGLSVAFSIGAENRLSKGAIVKNIAAIHVTIDHDRKKPSVSSQIAALRHLLSRKSKGTIGKYFSMAADGQIPLVVHTDNVDVIATLLDLLDELSQKVDAEVKLTISGGAEAHLLARELGAAGVGVILTRPRPFPTRWSGQQILPGLPLTSKSAVQVFLDNSVTVGFGIEENWQARNAWFDAAWEAINAGGDLDRETALGLISVNLEKLLGLELKGHREMVVWRGGDVFDMHSKVVAVISKPRQQVDIM
ncbi:hypothetical protein CPB86DRAFT_807236 [Serendipita vermifera]|nr:hypothetical protein CPB86DRAFT_807236 [Serendipita vermifera]